MLTTGGERAPQPDHLDHLEACEAALGLCEVRRGERPHGRVEGRGPAQRPHVEVLHRRRALCPAQRLAPAAGGWVGGWAGLGGGGGGWWWLMWVVVVVVVVGGGTTKPTKRFEGDLRLFSREKVRTENSSLLWEIRGHGCPLHGPPRGDVLVTAVGHDPRDGLAQHRYVHEARQAELRVEPAFRGEKLEEATLRHVKRWVRRGKRTWMQCFVKYSFL